MKNIPSLLQRFWLWITFRKMCPVCGGTGQIWSEEMAKYEDHGVKCDRCLGRTYIFYWNKFSIYKIGYIFVILEIIIMVIVVIIDKLK
jgi:excinuclease UvrABC ATPase subunit